VTYAVFQSELDMPSPAALRKPLQVLSELVALDAVTFAKDAYGMLMGGLSFEHANRFAEALNQNGVPVEVVDERDIIALPPAKHLWRIDCVPEHLVVYDALQRTTLVAWSHVILAAAGVVCMPEVQRTDRDRIVVRGTGGHGGAVPLTLTDVTTREAQACHPRLEIFLEVPPGRIRLQGHECQYNYLGERLTQQYMTNFEVLVGDVVRSTGRALHNRGAESLGSGRGITFRYPTEHAFEEEITWLLWGWMKKRRCNAPCVE
jgi:hypothetical protein